MTLNKSHISLMFYPYPAVDESEYKKNPCLYFDTLRGAGSTFETYNVNLTPALNLGGVPADLRRTKLVAKLHIAEIEDIASGDIYNEHPFERELKLYAGPLSELQGSVVPRIYGAWETDVRDRLIVMEDGGSSPSEERRRDESFQ